MKITCQECQSNFSVADEKVAKTIVKIRCKKCGATMIVDGNAGTTRTERASMPDDAPAISTRELEEEPAATKAARREGGRDQGKDLFGDAAKAGSETEGEKPDAKLTGERNESSVLFSLKSLTDKDPAKEEKKDEKTTAAGDGSGLIDIRSLAGKKEDDGAPKKGVEDILSLGGGGAFGATLTAPNLAAPAPELIASPSTAPPEQRNNRGIIFAIVGSAVFLGLVIVVAVVATRPSGDTQRPDGVSTNGSGAPSTVAVNETAKPTGEAHTAPVPTDTTNAKPPGQLPTSIPTGHGTAATGTGTPTGKPTTAPTETVAAIPTGPPKPLSLEEELRKKAGTPPPVKTAEAAGAGNFDRGAAASSLASISIAGCKKPDGPTGSGHVTVTFDPSGSVQSAILDGGDYPGTPVGGCIAGKYRGAHVPAFTGSPVKVGKSFTL